MRKVNTLRVQFDAKSTRTDVSSRFRQRNEPARSITASENSPIMDQSWDEEKSVSAELVKCQS